MRKHTPFNVIDVVSNDQGFTLLEVLVALSILSMSFGILFAIFSQVLHRMDEGRMNGEARALAETMLAEAQVMPVTDVRARQGHTDDGLNWALSLQPYGSVQDRAAWSMSLVRISVRVSWAKRDNDHELVLSSLRLFPKEAESR